MWSSAAGHKFHPYNAAMDQRAHPAGAPAPPTLSERQRKHLRGLAHALKPVIRIGNAGLTAAVTAEATRALDDHEFIKAKGPDGYRAARDELFATLARASGTALVHRIGNGAVLSRPHATLPRILIPDA